MRNYIACFNQEDNEYEILTPKILNQYAVNEHRKDTSKQLTDSGFSTNPKDIIEPEFSFDKLADLLSSNTYHEKCCDIISRHTCCSLFDFDVENEEQYNEEQYEFLKNLFNNFTEPINETLYKCLYDYNALGNGAIEIIKENGELVNLKYLPTINLRRTQDKKRFRQKIGNQEVWFVQYGMNYDENNEECDVDCRTGDFKPLNTLSDEEKANEILFLQRHNSKNEYYGSPSIIGAIPSIQNDISCVEYNTHFFKNFGVPAFLLSVVGDYEEEQPFLEDGETTNPNYDPRATIKYQIESQFKEIIKKPHSSIVLMIPSYKDGNSDTKIDVKVEKLNIDQKEGSFILYRQETRNEVIHAHGVPPYMVGIQETGTLGGTNIDVATQNYKQNKIAPLRQSVEREITALVRNEYEDIVDYRFSIIEPDNRDYSIELDMLMKLFQIGCITPAQIINNLGARFGLDYEDVKDDPYLNKHYINGVPIETVTDNAIMDDMRLETDTTNLIQGFLNEANSEKGIKDKIQDLI